MHRIHAVVSIQRAAQYALMLIVSVIGSLLHTPIYASAGCDQVNGGAWNASLQSFNIGATLSGFDSGDQLHFTASGTGQLTLLGSSGGPYVDLLVVNPPGTGSHIIATPYTSFRTLNDAVSGPLHITATCTPAPTPTPTSPAATTASTIPQALAKAFLLSRINGILLNAPSATNLLNRVAPAHADAPDTLADGLTAAKTPVPFVHKTPLGFDLWWEGRYSGFNNNANTLDSNGHVNLFYAGSDIQLNANLLIGVLMQFDWTKNDTNALASKLDGKGWLAGPYISARLHKNIFFNARAGWGQSSNDMFWLTTAGDFHTSRWLATSSLVGSWLKQHWRVTPGLEIAYMTERQHPFITWGGTLIPEQLATLGRLQFGPELGYRLIDTKKALLEPFTAIRGVWDFDNPTVPVIDGIVVGPNNLWGRLEGGLNVRTASGVVVRSLASWDGVGASNFSGYTILCTLFVPLD